jgi:hypothetical protein
MTSDNFCFYLQNRLIQTSQTGGQWYSDTSPFNIPWSVCPSVCLSAYQSIESSVCLSIGPPVCHMEAVQDCPSLLWSVSEDGTISENCLYSPVCPSIRRSVCLPVDLTFGLSVPLSFFHLDQETLTEVRGRVQLTSLLSQLVL